MQNLTSLKKAKQNKKQTKQKTILFPCHEINHAKIPSCHVSVPCFLKFLMFRYEDKQFTQIGNAE